MTEPIKNQYLVIFSQTWYQMHQLGLGENNSEDGLATFWFYFKDRT